MISITYLIATQFHNFIDGWSTKNQMRLFTLRNIRSNILNLFIYLLISFYLLMLHSEDIDGHINLITFLKRLELKRLIESMRYNFIHLRNFHRG